MKVNLRQIILMLALLLAITFGFIPGLDTAMTVHAADASGVCSNCGNIAWEFHGEVLTISKANGATSGDMCGLESYFVGWGSYVSDSDIKEIVIEKGVTNLDGISAWQNETIKKITIPEGVTTIDASKFYACKSLTSVIMPSTITSIGDWAFYGCSSLQSITISKGVTSIGKGAFSNCSGLTSITIPDTVTTISEAAFADCSGLINVTIPNNVTTIESYAFEDCSNLRSIIVSDSVTDIADFSLFGCSNLTSITVPCGLKERVTNGRIWDLANPIITYNHSIKSCTANDTTETITGTCSCGEKIYTATLKAPTKTAYTGKAIVATCTNNIPGFTPIIKYSGNNLVNGKPVNAGTYTATLTYDASTSVSLQYIIRLAPAPAKPHKITNVVSGVHVYWPAASGASKYGLWRSENGANGTYKLITSTTATHYTDTKVESGKTYYYKITTIDTANNVHSKKSASIGITYVGTPDITLRVNRAVGIGLGWDKIPGATGYAIYRKPYSGNSDWVRVATITDPNILKWDDTSVKTANGTVYRYTIRALAGSNLKTLSGCRTTGRTMVRLTSRELNSATKAGATSIKCNWSTSAQATGYEVRFMVGDTVYKTYTIGNYKTGTKTFKDLKAGQTYKIQVRTYKKVDGVGSFYSAWSTAKMVSL